MDDARKIVFLGRRVSAVGLLFFKYSEAGLREFLALSIVKQAGDIVVRIIDKEPKVL